MGNLPLLIYMGVLMTQLCDMGFGPCRDMVMSPASQVGPCRVIVMGSQTLNSPCRTCDMSCMAHVTCRVIMYHSRAPM